MTFSPAQLEVALHYYHSPKPHPLLHAPAIRSIIEGFITDGILKPAASTGVFTLTDKGNAWITMLCETPYPKEGGWVDPRSEKAVRLLGGINVR